MFVPSDESMVCGSEPATSPPLSRLAAEAARYRALVEASSHVIWRCPADGHHVESQPQWEAFTGQTFEELRGDGWVRVLHPDDRAAIFEQWSRALAERALFDAEYRVRRRDGAWRWMRCRAVLVAPTVADPAADAMVPPGDTPPGEWIGMMTDITDEREALAELARREADAQRLLAIVGHDLRQPLAVITHGAHALEHRLAGDAVRRDAHPSPSVEARLVATIARSARQAGEIVGTILDFARAALGGGIAIDPVPTELLALAAQAVRDARVRAAGRAIVLRHVMPAPDDVSPDDADAPGDGAPPTVRIVGDPARIAQALGNLLANAIVHGTPDAPIEVRVEAQSSRVLVAVRNGGPPIDDVVLGRLFEPMVRGVPSDEAPPRDDGGLGLGLYIVREIVEAHGGRVWASSGAGCVEFTMVLPRHAAPSRRAFRDAPAPGTDGSGATAVAAGARPSRAAGEAPGARAATRAVALPAWARHIRDPRVAALHARWCELATVHAVPPLAALRCAHVRGWAHEMCVVRVDPLVAVPGAASADGDGRPRAVLTWEEVGVGLETRLGHALTGRVVVLHEMADDDPLAEWVEDYAEALARRRPAYRYVRLGAPATTSASMAGTRVATPPGLLERIVLPCSADEFDGVTYLLALVRFTALETADGRRVGEIDPDAYT
ncbi:MAG: HAMP domain-containing histidine kinase [Gemmatimonadaceae bacterium]|nr:HAMP domain-containing histidine kinase [Gemmatimonadaceae bacterium]